MIPYIVTVLVLIFILSQVVKIMNEYERGVIFRLGRLIASKGRL
jgi:regulator of protease activity HflC (stomatin/prohibitin superfamily)